VLAIFLKKEYLAIDGQAITDDKLMKKILVFGENGQVARALHNHLADKAVFVGRDIADFMQPDDCIKLVHKLQPEIIINAVAYTQVDKAESEVELAMQINAHTPHQIALAAKEIGAVLVHYSTDYVFDGKGDAPFTENMPTNPLNIYGKSKCLGEELIANVGGKYLIFRTSWVYDEVGKNFFTTMLRLGAEREQLKVVADQVGAPSYAPHLAGATMQAVENAQSKEQFPCGIYHMCGAGETSWHGFAEAIFAGARNAGLPLKLQQCLPIPASEYPTPALRPYNSRLNCTKLANQLGVLLPHWEIGLNEAMAKFAN
jgi:dTDP-4-dehydrorhamnose reductase